jgi:hypothetical protein
MSQTRTSQKVTTNSQPLTQVQATASAICSTVKNTEDARHYLAGKGWLIAGESVALDILARTLFALVIESKLNQQASATISAVAFLITENHENQAKKELTDKITKHLKETFNTLATDLCSKIDQQAQSLQAAAQSHTTLTESLKQTHEKLDEVSQKMATNVKSYSQVAASPPPASSPPLAHPISLSQVQIRNREEIKKRQILIDFNSKQDLQLENMDETVLARKANDAIKTIWAATSDPKPTIPKIKSAVPMRNGGLLLEFDSPDSAKWLLEESNRTRFLDNIGSGANIKDRSYQVIVQFAPVEFKPEDEESIRAYEFNNGLPANSILKAEWIKPAKDRKPNQKVATLRVYHKDANSANQTLSEGANILGKKTVPKKPKREPIRCLKCQSFGHERRNCPSSSVKCAKCTGPHEASECKVPPRSIECANCQGHHPSYDRDCPRFREKCAQLDARCPENNLAFYPTDDSWSWATIDQQPRASPPQPHPRNHPTQGPGQLRQTTLSGTNTTPLGRAQARGQQSRPHNSS